MQVRRGSRSGRQLMLVCRAALGSGLKTRGPGLVVIFRPVENSKLGDMAKTVITMFFYIDRC